MENYTYYPHPTEGCKHTLPEEGWPEDLSDHLDSGFLIERFEDILRYLHASGLMFPSWDEMLRCLKDVWCPDKTELSP